MIFGELVSMTRAAGVVLLVLLATGCGGSPAGVGIHVSPALSVEDQALWIRVDGLAPHQHLSLELRSIDAKRYAFVSRASFVADGNGKLDLARAQPLRGSSYTGVWQMGLLTSMAAPKAPPLEEYAWGTGPQKFVVTAIAKGRTIASAAFTRRWSRGTYTTVTETVATAGFDGTFRTPAGARNRPAVLRFGGSEGGLGLPKSDLLETHGLPVLTIGYFHAPGLPDTLTNIPLEYFRTALEWLEHRPEVDPRRVSVLGISYGSEAALLLGVHYPRRVHGVVALVPSSVVTCGIRGAGRQSLSSPSCLDSPWTLGGKPLPHTTLVNNPHPWDDPRAVIPVERIKAPVLLDCGESDQIWSSCAYARAIVARRKAYGESTQLYAYPDAGHYVGSPFHYEPGSLANDIFVPATERGREDLWPHLLRFLRTQT